MAYDAKKEITNLKRRMTILEKKLDKDDGDLGDRVSKIAEYIKAQIRSKSFGGGLFNSELDL